MKGSQRLRKSHQPKRRLGRRKDKLLEGEAGRHVLNQYYLKHQGNPNISAGSRAGRASQGDGTGASSSTRHSRQHQAATGCGTAAASQPGETHTSEVVRLLPRTCTLLSNPLGCEVFQKQKVILLQSRKGHFHQPAGKTSATTSTTAAENKVSPEDNKSSR